MEQAAPRPCVPIGYRFKPTPEELIRFYLNPWVVTGKHAATADLFPPGVVCVADIYASDPDALTSRFQHYAHDGYWYFLCVARWKGGKVGTRMNRCVEGGGTWHGSSSRKVVGRDGRHQGFDYRAAGNVKTVWIMEEFVTSLKEATDGEGVKVICRVCVSRRALADVEEETDEVVAGSNNQQLLPHGEHDVERSDVASTAHQGGLMMTTDAGVKRARLDEEHYGLAAYQSVSVAAPSPAEYYAGTSQGAPESAAVSNTTWQQSMTEQFMGVNGEPEPLAMVESAGMEGLPLLWAPPPDVEEETNIVVGSYKQLLLHGDYDVERSDIASTAHQAGLLMMTDAGVKRARFDGEHGLAAYPSVSVVAPSPAEYYTGTWQGAPESAPVSNTTWQQSMMEQGMGVDGESEPLAVVESDGMGIDDKPEPLAGMGIDGEPEPLDVVESTVMGIDGEPEPLAVVDSTSMSIDGEPEPLDVVESAGIGGLPVPPMDDDLDLTSLYEQVNVGSWDSLDFRV